MFKNVAHFDLWCSQNEISSTAKLVIEQIRSSNPSRSVRSGRSNVTGRFPSPKMGVVIQFESHKNELPHIRILEDNNKVIEYYDQPPSIKLNYKGATGRNLGIYHTPDFFVIRDNSAGWEECKTEQELAELEAKNSNRYYCDNEGDWHSLAGERYAAQFGFYYKVISSKSISWIFQRNLEFLEDYLRVDAPLISSVALEIILPFVRCNPSISLEELFNQTSDKVCRDDVFMMIAHEKIYVDLYSIALPEFKYVKVFPDREAALAYQNIIHSSSSLQTNSSLHITLEPNEKIRWDNKIWRIVNVGQNFISLLDEENKLIKLALQTIETLLGDGQIERALSTDMSISASALEHPEVKHKFLSASPDQLAIANYRFGIVRTHLAGEFDYDNAKLSARTVRLWTSEYLKSDISYGCGYIGLIPLPRSGNTKQRLPDASKNLMDDFIKNEYENRKQKRRYEVHSQYALACEERQIQPASYTTFCKAIKARPRKKQQEKRVGRRGAYNESEFYFELDLTTPRHGDHPFHIVHIDHTVGNVEARCSHTGRNMGRPVVSFMTDAFTRRILAKYTTYDPPSYRTVMMLIRECVRRFQRFPQIIVVDGAVELSCTYVETLFAMFEATKKVRPPAEPRFGSIIERLFGTSESQFFNNLQGNTQIMKNVRQVTKSVNPRNLALWTLDSIDEGLTRWAYEVYDTNEHPALGQSPREAFDQGIALYGPRAFKRITYNETFLMMTMPQSPRGVAKVYNGHVKLNNIRYWADVFRDNRVRDTRVPLRFDPWNAGTIYAFALGRWVECYSDYHQIFRNRTEREMMLASEELRRRNTLHSRNSKITARKLAEFLQSIEAEEVLLHQRLADIAARQTAVRNGILPSRYLYAVPKNSTLKEPDTLLKEGAVGSAPPKTDSTPYPFKTYKTI